MTENTASRQAFTAVATPKRRNAGSGRSRPRTAWNRIQAHASADPKAQGARQAMTSMTTSDILFDARAIATPYGIRSALVNYDGFSADPGRSPAPGSARAIPVEQEDHERAGDDPHVP